MTPNRVFIGFDHRQPVSYQVLSLSLFSRASKPVTIAPLVLQQLPIERVGLTPFTYSRFLVPWLCDFKGCALFLDADMLVRGDITELFAWAESGESAGMAVQVVKNPRKFEWPSAILWNCEHEANRALTPEYVADTTNGLFDWGWLGGADSPWIGPLPSEWNHLVGYDVPRKDAKLVHYTMGVPAFPETEASEYREEWQLNLNACNSAAPWAELMGQSVHATHLPDGRVLPHFHPDVVAWKTEVMEKEAAQ